MTERLQVVPAEVSAAATQAADAADQARGQDGSSCLSRLESALPGSDTAAGMAGLRADWTTYTDYWVRQAGDYADALDEAATTYSHSDAEASSYLETTLATLESVPEPS